VIEKRARYVLIIGYHDSVTGGDSAVELYDSVDLAEQAIKQSDSAMWFHLIDTHYNLYTRYDCNGIQKTQWAEMA
jgi:hypothetical protein